jgi:hypothetical protein
MESPDVQAKWGAARRWANHVSADEAVAGTWHYLLLAERDVDTAKGSWTALKKLGGVIEASRCGSPNNQNSADTDEAPETHQRPTREDPWSFASPAPSV